MKQAYSVVLLLLVGCAVIKLTFSRTTLALSPKATLPLTVPNPTYRLTPITPAESFFHVVPAPDARFYRVTIFWQDYAWEADQLAYSPSHRQGWLMIKPGVVTLHPHKLTIQAIDALSASEAVARYVQNISQNGFRDSR